MTIVKALYGHNSFETAYKVDNYPYGRLQCTMYFWLEFKTKKGYRLVTQSINPKNGKLNKPHPSTYIDFAANMYLDENNHCQWTGLGVYSDAEKFLEFIKAFPENPEMKNIALLCKIHAAKYARWLAEGRSAWGELSEHDKEVRYPKDIQNWKAAYNAAMGLPEENNNS